MNPYEVLGIPPNATPQQVKAAYRKLSRRWHPDQNPGKDTSAKFNEVNAAYRLLSDPERRERFDRTGVADEDAPDNSLSEALAVLSVAYTETILEGVSTGKNLRRVNLIAVMKAKIVEKLKPVRKELSDMDKIEAAFKESSGRFETADHDNPLLAIIHNHLNNVRQQREIRLRVIATHEAAEKILSTYSYWTDKEDGPDGFAGVIAALKAGATRASGSGPYFIFE